MTTTYKTPAGRLRAAFRTLDAVGFETGMVRSCCGSCATLPNYKVDAPMLMAWEIDATSGNESRGWFTAPSRDWTGYLHWENIDPTRMEMVDKALTAAGFRVTLPANDYMNITLEMSPTATEVTR